MGCTSPCWQFSRSCSSTTPSACAACTSSPRPCSSGGSGACSPRLWTPSRGRRSDSSPGGTGARQSCLPTSRRRSGGRFNTWGRHSAVIKAHASLQAPSEQNLFARRPPYPLAGAARRVWRGRALYTGAGGPEPVPVRGLAAARQPRGRRPTEQARFRARTGRRTRVQAVSVERGACAAPAPPQRQLQQGRRGGARGRSSRTPPPRSCHPLPCPAPAGGGTGGSGHAGSAQRGPAPPRLPAPAGPALASALPRAPVVGPGAHRAWLVHVAAGAVSPSLHAG